MGSRYAQVPPRAILFALFEKRELCKHVSELRKTAAWDLVEKMLQSASAAIVSRFEKAWLFLSQASRSPKKLLWFP
jgi:hypothetical protein